MTSIITLQRANRFLLEKQHLLPHVTPESVERIVGDVVGLLTTVAATPYLSLFARSGGFEKSHLDEALYDRSTLAKLRCVRTTIYAHTRTNLPMVYVATASLIQDASRNYMLRRGVDETTYKRLSQAVLELLDEEDLSVAEIRRTLDTDLDLSALLYHMCDLGLLLRRRPIRSWRDRSFRYGRFDKYYPDVDLQSMGEDEALIEYVRQYLAAFGPVREGDVYWWFGLPKSKIRLALDGIQEEIQELEIEILGGHHIMLRKQRDRLEQIASDPSGIVNFLPMLDSYLMGYQARERYLDPRYATYVFDRSGNATNTILLDGKIIGIWDFEHTSPPCMKLFFFENITSGLREKISTHAESTGTFIAEGEVVLQFRASMTPLQQRTAGGFMRPLKDL